ncbi:hypothetical protein KI387_019758, partial [Taxus chinensis]
TREPGSYSPRHYWISLVISLQTGDLSFGWCQRLWWGCLSLQRLPPEQDLD